MGYTKLKDTNGASAGVAAAATAKKTAKKVRKNILLPGGFNRKAGEQKEKWWCLDS